MGNLNVKQLTYRYFEFVVSIIPLWQRIGLLATMKILDIISDFSYKPSGVVRRVGATLPYGDYMKSDIGCLRYNLLSIIQHNTKLQVLKEPSTS